MLNLSTCYVARAPMSSKHRFQGLPAVLGLGFWGLGVWGLGSLGLRDFLGTASTQEQLDNIHNIDILGP